MFQQFRDHAVSWFQRRRPEQGRRLAGLFLTLLVEGGLLLVVLTFGSSIVQHEKPNDAITVVNVKTAPERSRTPTAKAQKSPTLQPSAQASASRHETPPRPAEPAQEQPSPPLIRLSPSDMAATDIATMTPRRAEATPATTRPKMGPPDTGTPIRDTQRVGGSGPNGEPLYAAAWYREPYDDELSGYLSTTTGPGWGLIACRTAPDYRVEDCVKIDEYPTGSNIARAILAAAWQFRVRPPRLGGQPRIGEWVRIRIDYDYRRK
ncbi:MAG: hypothetical protein IT550_00570 [Novosphingobium sp.]|nr:hypothetical protein [Novosphingobium sp.]